MTASIRDGSYEFNLAIEQLRDQVADEVKEAARKATKCYRDVKGASVIDKEARSFAQKGLKIFQERIEASYAGDWLILGNMLLNSSKFAFFYNNRYFLGDVKKILMGLEEA